VTLWVMSVATAAAVGYVLRSHSDSVTAASGSAYVGLDQASASADGWVYAIPIDVTWQGADGSWRDGRPECLASAGQSVPLRFGWVAVSHPDGASWRQVVWVSCIV